MVRQRRNGILNSLCIVLAGIAVAIATGCRSDPEANARAAFAAAREAAQGNELDKALKLIDEAAKAEQPSTEMLHYGAELARKNGQPDKALDYLVGLPQGADTNVAQAQFEAGDLAWNLGMLSVAERGFRDALQSDPSHDQARLRLIQLLRIEGRNFECRPLILDLMQRGVFYREHLYVMLSTEWVWLDAQELKFLEYCHVQGHDGALALLGPSRRALSQDASAAKPREVLRQIATGDRVVIEAIAWLGALLAEGNQSEEFLRWQTGLSTAAESHPQTWFGRGLSLERLGRGQEAARCYWEAVDRDPNHRAATYQLGRLLAQLGRDEAAHVALSRAKKLAEVDQLVHIGAKTERGELAAETIARLAEVLVELGRGIEARGWVQLGLNSDSQHTGLTEMAGKLKSVDGSEMNAVATIEMLDLGDLPLPTDLSYLGRHAAPADAVEKSSELAFDDSSHGLDFSYFNGAQPTDERGRMFEFSGGGIGVVDFDRDGWPDMYCSQGINWPPLENEMHTDRLFWNLSGKTWRDVTDAACVSDTQFSHGVTAGDFNDDGFTDVHVANMGANRLLVNLGDGTFQDVTEAAQVAGNEWTLGAAFCDLNGDAISDLWVVNYLGGEDVYSRICEHEGKPVQCLAAMFAGERNRLYLGDGEGSFRDVSHQTGFAESIGKGMGIVAGDLSNTGNPGAYIVNDGLPNSLWQVGGEHQDLPRLEDAGVFSGVGTSYTGQSQASMGIAASDLNADGIVDFFVTNFYREQSNLFVSEPSGGYVDQALQAGLAVASRDMMGWGAQFFDPDLDGDCDLLVANGHLGLRSSRGNPSRMPTVLWRNDSAANRIRFSRVTPNEYFSGAYLGRSVATLDWNRDGKMDACVTHVDRPLALLTNQTSVAGSFVAIQFVGVQSERDGTGAVVQAETNGVTRYFHVLSGDGFEASNDSVMVIGLGDAQQIDRLSVKWPSGIRQETSALAANQFLVIIEGQSAPVPINFDPVRGN